MHENVGSMVDLSLSNLALAKSCTHRSLPCDAHCLANLATGSQLDNYKRTAGSQLIRVKQAVG